MVETSNATTISTLASDKFKIEDKYRAIIETSRQQAELARQQAENEALSRTRNLQQNLASRGLLGTGIEQLGETQNQILLAGELNKQAISSSASEAQLMYQMMSEKDAATQNYSALKKDLQATALSLVTADMDSTDVSNLVNSLFNTYGYAPTTQDAEDITSVLTKYITTHQEELGATPAVSKLDIATLINNSDFIDYNSTDEEILNYVNTQTKLLDNAPKDGFTLDDPDFKAALKAVRTNLNLGFENIDKPTYADYVASLKDKKDTFYNDWRIESNNGGPNTIELTTTGGGKITYANSISLDNQKIMADEDIVKYFIDMHVGIKTANEMALAFALNNTLAKKYKGSGLFRTSNVNEWLLNYSGKQKTLPIVVKFNQTSDGKNIKLVFAPQNGEPVTNLNDLFKNLLA